MDRNSQDTKFAIIAFLLIALVVLICNLIAPPVNGAPLVQIQSPLPTPQSTAVDWPCHASKYETLIYQPCHISPLATPGPESAKQKPIIIRHDRFVWRW